MIPVVWLSFNSGTPARGYWDQGLLEDLFHGWLWNPVGGFDYHHVDDLAGLDGAVVVLPARSQVDHVDEINAAIANLRWVVVFVGGDEEAVFPIEQLQHPNMRTWVMNPRPGRHDVSFGYGTNYPPQTAFHLSESAPEKDLDWFFAGQVTHRRRELCVEQLRTMSGGELVETPGFTQGLASAEYYALLERAKVVPAPSGPCTPDTFRLFEALEAGCVPIADTTTPTGECSDNYWPNLFGEEPPFSLITDWNDLPGYTQDVVDVYPKLNNKVGAWWMAYKRKLAYRLADDVRAVSGIGPESDRLLDTVTVVLSTSWAPLHPSLDHLEKTIDSIRVQLPDVEILVTVDGLRDEYAEHAADYDEYIRRLIWRCNRGWTNVLPILFDTHHHQARMAREALREVRTPTLLYMEHDTPLEGAFIDWDSCVQAIRSAEANLIRFHHESEVLDVHEHLMIDGVEDVMGAPLRRTVQWSQRPHLAATAFYRYILTHHFSPDATCFIEDRMYGVLENAWRQDGFNGWALFRTWMYHPVGNIRRTYHLDSRAGYAKHDDKQVW